jgi:hypothetical protein
MQHHLCVRFKSSCEETYRPLPSCRVYRFLSASRSESDALRARVFTGAKNTNFQFV